MAESEIISILPAAIRRMIRESGILFACEIQEIRMRVNQPLLLKAGDREWGISSDGCVAVLEDSNKNSLLIVTWEQIQEVIQYISRYSAYAYAPEMRRGFITIRGGHRVGLCGKVVLEEDQIKTFQYITCINIRIAHAITGCADRVLPRILKQGKLCHTLILSAPGQGKTTLLRDLIRQASDGNVHMKGCQVSVIDERSELAACYQGIPQNDVGCRTDVLDGCSKAEGMMLMLRSMSPEVIAVDEIGSREDVEAVMRVVYSGSVILATVHGQSLENFCRKVVFSELVMEKIFERYVVISRRSGVGRPSVEYQVYDRDFQLLGEDS